MGQLAASARCCLSLRRAAAASLPGPQPSAPLNNTSGSTATATCNQAQQAPPPTFIACMTAGTSPARPPATYAASTLACTSRPSPPAAERKSWE